MNIRHNKILNMKMLEKIRIIKHQKITNKNSVFEKISKQDINNLNYILSVLSIRKLYLIFL